MPSLCPSFLPALSHRQVSESARILQGSLAGARDAALHTGTPSGIRLLPDPAFPLIYLPSGQIDPGQPLAANRIIPIEVAPAYSEGMLSVGVPAAGFVLNVPYPAATGGGYYPFANNSSSAANILMVKEAVAYFDQSTPPQTKVNSPTTWYWNIRVGDKLQINSSGLWYTVVGPMVVTPQQGNSELFVNVGAAGTQSPLSDSQGGVTVYPEFLFLVNGIDDNKNGWIDEGYDGVDNNLAQENATNSTPFVDELAEWEAEAWPAGFLANPPTNVPYTVTRRAGPVQNAREVSLPTNVVIDMTTWANTAPERSQFPPGVINPFTGYVDILLYPNGTVVPTTLYSTPSSFGMAGAFFHFWLAERSDVAVPSSTATAPPFLPPGNINQQLQAGNPYSGLLLKGEYSIVTLVARTGRISTSDAAPFDNPASPANGSAYNTAYPFLAVEQGRRLAGLPAGRRRWSIT